MYFKSTTFGELFISLTCPFKNDGKNHMEMRNELVNYIGDNFAFFENHLAIDNAGTDNIQLVRHLRKKYNRNNLESTIQIFENLPPEEKVNIYMVRIWKYLLLHKVMVSMLWSLEKID